MKTFLIVLLLIGSAAAQETSSVAITDNYFVNTTLDCSLPFGPFPHDWSFNNLEIDCGNKIVRPRADPSEPLEVEATRVKVNGMRHSECLLANGWSQWPYTHDYCASLHGKEYVWFDDAVEYRCPGIFHWILEGATDGTYWCRRVGR
jgi:hypothetical protein